MHTVYDKNGNAVTYKNKVDAQQMVNAGVYSWTNPKAKAEKPAKAEGKAKAKPKAKGKRK